MAQVIHTRKQAVAAVSRFMNNIHNVKYPETKKKVFKGLTSKQVDKSSWLLFWKGKTIAAFHKNSDFWFLTWDQKILLKSSHNKTDGASFLEKMGSLCKALSDCKGSADITIDSNYK